VCRSQEQSTGGTHSNHPKKRKSRLTPSVNPCEDSTQEPEYEQNTGGTRSNHTKKHKSISTPSVNLSSEDSTQELKYGQSAGGTRSNHTKTRKSQYTPSVNAPGADQLEYVQTMEHLFGEDHDFDSDGASLRYEYIYVNMQCTYYSICFVQICMCSADVDTSSSFNPGDMGKKLDSICSMLEGLVDHQKKTNDRLSMLEDAQQQQRQSNIETDVTDTSVSGNFQTPQRDARHRARVNTPVIDEARRYLFVMTSTQTYQRSCVSFCLLFSHESVQCVM